MFDVGLDFTDIKSPCYTYNMLHVCGKSQRHTFTVSRYLTRSSATAKSTAHPSCLFLVYFMTFIGRESV